MNLTVFTNRKASRGKVVNLSWAELVVRLSEPVVTDETPEEYEAMTNEQRTEVKDVGGFIGGECLKGKRSKATVMNRCLLTIDADHASPTAIEEYNQLFDYRYFCHSTHSSTASAPRLRWIFPLTRPVTAEEYRALVSIAKEWLGEDSIDETTDQPERLMFWPSISKGGHWTCQLGGADIIDPDELLDGYELPEAAPQEKMRPEGDDAFEVPEGQRNKTLFGFAASLRGQGLNYNDIRAMLDVYNEGHCTPPVPDEELDTIARSVCGRYAPGDHVLPTLRDAYDDFKDLGPWKDGPRQEKKQEPTDEVAPIEFETVADLIDRNPEPPQPIIENFLYPGFILLTAPAKYGKSWMCLDMCRAISKGEDFMGMKAKKTGVFYIAFEEFEAQVNKRWAMVNGTPEKTKYLILKSQKRKDTSLDDICKDAKANFPGLDDRKLFAQTLHVTLEAIQKRYGIKVEVVIFDIIGVIRGVRKSNEGVYNHDLQEAEFLHRLAMFENIAIIGVHHTNKLQDENDPLNNVSGSVGLIAGADQTITLYREKRANDETFMHIDGRFFPSRTDVIRRDADTNRWEMLGSREETADEREKSEFYSDPMVKTILYYLSEAEDMAEDPSKAQWKITVRGFAETIRQHTGKRFSPVNIGRALSRLKAGFEMYEGVVFDSYKSGADRGYKFYHLPDVDPT